MLTIEKATMTDATRDNHNRNTKLSTTGRVKDNVSVSSTGSGASTSMTITDVCSEPPGNDSLS